jgi:hypothetical protein
MTVPLVKNELLGKRINKNVSQKKKNNKMPRCYMTVPLLKNELLEDQRKRKQKSKLKEKNIKMPRCYMTVPLVKNELVSQHNK